MHRAPAGGAFAALRLRWGLDADDPLVAATFTRLLAPMVDAGGEPDLVVAVAPIGGHVVRVTAGNDVLYPSLRSGSLVSHLLIEINRRAAASWPGPVLHAGVVSRRGRAVALCGTSGSGKTTLTAALGAAGWPVLADEVCAVDASGVAQAYGKPLALRPASVEVLGAALGDRARTAYEEDELFVTAEALAGGAGSASPLAAIVFPEFVPGAACEATPMTAGECLVEAMHHTLASGFSSAEAFDVLRRIAGTAAACRVRYGDVSDAVAVVQRVVDRSA